MSLLVVGQAEGETPLSNTHNMVHKNTHNIVHKNTHNMVHKMLHHKALGKIIFSNKCSSTITF